MKCVIYLPYANTGRCFWLQLQDTLLQREEEVARLQEENNELRHFLSSSFVRNLELKARVRSPTNVSVLDGLDAESGLRPLSSESF